MKKEPWLGTPAATTEVLKTYGFHFQKRYGQNFLIDPHVLRKITAAADIGPEDCVLEIGPGIGTLTQYLAFQAKKVFAVEIDDALLPVLQETLKDWDNVTVIHNDILKVDLHALVREENEGKPVKVVANLPYYITSPVIMRLLEERLPINSITVMVQKEAAERITAPLGTRKAGAVTASVSYYAEAKTLFKVSAGSFMPPPKVDSAVIRLDIRKTQPVRVEDEKLMFAVIRASFAQRRKTILNSISNSLGISKSQLSEALGECGVSPTARAENLTLEDFAAIAESVRSYLARTQGK